MSSPAPSLDPNEKLSPEELTALLTQLFSAFGKIPTSDQVEAYLDSLSDLEPLQLLYGISQAIRKLRFLPVPAEIRELAEQVPRTAKVHPVDCEICDGSGWAFSKVLQRALRCREYVKWRAEVSALADEALAKLETGEFETGPLERISLAPLE